MIEYVLAHVGVNAQNEEEATRSAQMLEALFGWKTKVGNSSVFAGKELEFMKTPYLGKNGHIAVGTPDVPAAVADLEARGFRFRPESAKYRKDGVLNVSYLQEEICGFAVHIVGISK